MHLTGTRRSNRSRRVGLRAIGGLLASCAVLWSVACEGGSRDPGRAQVADGGLKRWELVEPPIFTFSEDPGSEVVLFQVAPEAVILTSGRIVVGNGGTEELLYLDQTGRFLLSAGRRGEGPGEFSGIASLYPLGDTVIAYDFRLRRASFFGPDGTHQRDVWLEAPRPVDFVGVLGDGRVISGPFTPSSGQPRPYTVWDSSRTPGMELSGPAEHPSHSFVNVTPERVTHFGVRGACLPTILETVLGHTVYVVDSGAGQVLALQTDGTTSELYRGADRPIVTEQIHEVWIGRMTNPDSQRVVLERIGQVGNPLPSAWDQVLPDPGGRLWLRQAACWDSSADQVWDIIETSGAHAGTLQLSADVRVLAARGDRVLIVRRDEFDVESIALYRIQSR